MKKLNNKNKRKLRNRKKLNPLIKKDLESV